PYSSNSVRCFPLPFSFFPSNPSQLTSSIGGGTTRTNVLRLTASNPSPPRDVTSYLPRPNSSVLPPDVSGAILWSSLLIAFPHNGSRPGIDDVMRASPLQARVAQLVVNMPPVRLKGQDDLVKRQILVGLFRILPRYQQCLLTRDRDTHSGGGNRRGHP